MVNYSPWKKKKEVCFVFNLTSYSFRLQSWAPVTSFATRLRSPLVPLKDPGRKYTLSSILLYIFLISWIDHVPSAARYGTAFTLPLLCELTFFNNSALRSLTTVNKVTQRKDRAMRGQSSLSKVKKHHSNSLPSGASALAWQRNALEVDKYGKQQSLGSD